MRFFQGQYLPSMSLNYVAINPIQTLVVLILPVTGGGGRLQSAPSISSKPLMLLPPKLHKIMY